VKKKIRKNQKANHGTTFHFMRNINPRKKEIHLTSKSNLQATTEQFVKRRADIEVDTDLVGSQGGGVVGKFLSVVDGRVTGDVDGENAVLVIAGDHLDDLGLVDGRGHGEGVVAGFDRDVLENRGADVLALDSQVEGHGALESC
jgi:hypothetical protein